MSFTQIIGYTVYHPDARWRAIVTSIMAAICLAINFFRLQVFCMPVWWASLIAIAVFINIIVFEFTNNTRFRPFSLVLLGLSVPVWIYCILFLADPWSGFQQYIVYVLCVVLLGLGLPAFFPFLLLYHTYRYIKITSRAERTLFAMGIMIPIATFIAYYAWVNPKYSRLEALVATSTGYSESIAAQLPADYVTERVLGTGFLYHTRLEYFYDGWRPPLHDPFYNAFLWFSYDGQSRSYYPVNQLSLATREQYYKRLFPDRPLRALCPCAYTHDGLSYFNEPNRRQ